MNHAQIDNLKLPIRFSIILFLIAAILGLSMRTAFVIDMPEWFHYRQIQHAHSHIALLGWLFGIFFIIIIQVFQLNWQKYATLYWSFQTLVIGMLFTFPLIGYTSISIVLSSLHIILTYVFVLKVWKDLKTTTIGRIPVLFLKTSLFFLSLSTLGTWALSPIIMAGMKGTALYYASIQFYLHFQFNGWLIFAVIAIFLALLHIHQITISTRRANKFYYSLVTGTVLTYALAVTWSTPHIGIFLVNSIGVLIQLFALALFIKILLETKNQIKTTVRPFIYNIVMLSLFVLVLKILIQSVVVIPVLAEVSYTIRNLVIGFIHLLMLGGLSLFAFSMISIIEKRSLNKIAIITFLVGVVTTELLLFIQGIMQWQGFGFIDHYYGILAFCSSIIVVAIALQLYYLTKK